MTAIPLSMPYGDHFSPGLEGKIGLYLHVPFCLRKCPYCSFFSVAGNSTRHDDYVQAIAGQINSILEFGWIEDRQVATVFVGGGTPSILEPQLLAGLLEQFRERFVITGEEMEISVEVNPATIGHGELAQLRMAGYNRISIGAQSLADEELQKIGRPHTTVDVIRTIADSRRAGFSNINIDLMFGLPGQTAASWKQTLNKALEEDPDHLAIYELTIEEGTPFALQKQQGRLVLPIEEEVLKMMTVTTEMLCRAGFTRYEISNYARADRECLHNINYWENGSYIGLGPGAVSCFSGRRYTAVHDINEFCRRIASGRDWWSDMEELNKEARFRETVVMGLRMTNGISMEGLIRRFGLHPMEYYGDTLLRFEQQRLVKIQGDRLRLSPLGMNLANQVMLQLV